MPTPYLKKLSKEGKGSVKELEKKWDKAGDIADDAGKGDNYAYRTGILKNMVGAAAARLKATTIKADANQFVLLTDTLTKHLGQPFRKPGNYTYCVDEGGRDFDIIVHDKGPAMHVCLEKDGRTKYECDVKTAAEGLKAVEMGIKQYIAHEANDAHSGQKLLQQLNAPKRLVMKK